MKVGLELEQELGFNPLQNGFVAATDSHNSNPGDVEEWDYRGSAGTAKSPAMRRLRQGNPDNKADRSSLKFNTSGGLAAVWAPENTREAIFDALARRETYATSGPRIALRFHAGWGIDEAMIDDPGLVQHLEAAAVPMGRFLPPAVNSTAAEVHVVWAVRDPWMPPCSVFKWSRAGLMMRARHMKTWSILPAPMACKLIRPPAAAQIMAPVLSCLPASTVPAPVLLN